MRYKIRRITASDATSLARLWRHSWTCTYGKSLGDLALTEMLKDLDDNGTTSILPGIGERGYCAVLDDAIHGSVVAVERGSTAYLWGLYVHPEKQRTGIGSQLLRAVAMEIETSHNIEIRVLTSSRAALDFYQAHGFVKSRNETTQILGSVSAEAHVMNVDVLKLKSLYASRAPSSSSPNT